VLLAVPWVLVVTPVVLVAIVVVVAVVAVFSPQADNNKVSIKISTDVNVKAFG